MQSLRKIVAIGVFAFALALGLGAQAAWADEVTIGTKAGAHVIEAEIADTDEERQTGLMFREEMDPDHGMLFDFGEARDVSMWMKNTLIPLDMLFIEDDGTILSIKQNAQPLSLSVIPSGGPVRYVLELNGGTAKRLGIAPGDIVAHPLIEEGAEAG